MREAASRGVHVESDPSASTVLATRGVVLARSGRAFATLPDLTIPRGRSVAILGASGSGKTTALMALAGIRAPASGEIVVEDTVLWGLSAVARDRFRGRRIGLVFQSFHLIDAVSVATNLALAARCAGLPPDNRRMDQLLETLQIAELRRKRADRISHGQAQRVAIARALFNKPAVVFADEPTSALDDASTARLLTLLKETAAIEGAGLIIATHDRRVIDSVDETIELRPVQ
ncbi:MAG: putative transport system ATP-binding protein [Rhodospirillaceae bacterium]|jgi:putative ABC transport system ATP-binding protein|nr:putative transport system ATP-binding protein [Rhodospirillaceae bacterium]